jgi:hypothetical protein
MASPRVVHWNGKDLPSELRELPAGTYVLEPVEASPLTADEEAGLRDALHALQAGNGRSRDDVRSRIDSIVRR